MANLVALQGELAVMTALLILHARALGYVLTYGDAYRPPEATWGHPDSLHKMRLAVDFNLFIDGKYQTDSLAYLPLGVYWESIGGTWGGRFEDGNHFSLAYGGMK
jgi:hypothetical protein